jgi:hypothetical protein
VHRTDAGADNEDMAGTLHQGILALFKDDPWLAFDLLQIPRPSDGTPIDRHAEVELDATHPFKERQGYPDLVMVAEDTGDGGAVIAVEAQNKFNKQKRWRIPAYQALLALEHELPTWVVVVSFARQMSRALQEWSTGDPPKLDVLLLDVDVVPVDAGREVGRERPAAVVLAAALHGSVGDFDAARIGVEVAIRLPQPQRDRYVKTILAALPEPQRDEIRRELPVEHHDPLIEIERQSGTFLIGRREGRQEGRRAALTELTLALLADRGVAVDAASEAQIRECEDLAQLQRWARRAAQATDVSGLFDGAEPKPKP